jgi:hypothetical protein
VDERCRVPKSTHLWQMIPYTHVDEGERGLLRVGGEESGKPHTSEIAAGCGTFRLGWTSYGNQSLHGPSWHSVSYCVASGTSPLLKGQWELCSPRGITNSFPGAHHTFKYQGRVEVQSRPGPSVIAPHSDTLVLKKGARLSGQPGLQRQCTAHALVTSNTNSARRRMAGI